MPDGTSGLSLSEMGISAVKKTAQVVKKHAGVAGGQVKQQLGGTFVPPQKPQQSVGQSNSPLSKIGGGSFDIASFGKSANQQLSGSGNAGSGTFFPGKMPPAANPPSESAPNQGGAFDLGSVFGEKNPFGQATPKANSTQQVIDPQISAQFEEQKEKDRQQMESLRKKLHDIYFEEFIRKSEGKGQDKQQEEQKRDQLREEDEEEKQRQKQQLMEPINETQGPQKGMGASQKKKSGFSLMKILKPKMGSHEGRAGKG